MVNKIKIEFKDFVRATLIILLITIIINALASMKLYGANFFRDWLFIVQTIVLLQVALMLMFVENFYVKKTKK